MRIDAKTKRDAQRVLERLGLDLSSAVKIFLRKVATTRSIPFEVRTENGFTPAQEREMLRETAWARKYGKRFDSIEDMMKSLKK